MFDRKLRQLQESWAKFEEDELEEKLTPKERRKKQSKNIGVELEFASNEDPDELEGQIDDLVKQYFGDEYEASTTTNTEGGKARVFEVTEDSSARLDDGTDEDKLTEIADSIWYIYDFDYDEIRQETRDDAEGDLDQDDYEDEEEYEQAIEEYIDENIGEKENENIEAFLYGSRDIVRNEYGSDAGDELFDKLRKTDLYELDFDDVVEVVNEMGMNGYFGSEEGSFPYGIEVVSPRLILNDDTIEKLAGLFYDMGDLGVMHPNAGLHVHIGLTEGMNFIHLLRMAHYLDTFGVTKVAGRDYNQWATSHEYVYDRLDEIVDNVRHGGMSQEYAYQNLDELMKKLVETRYKVSNFASMNKGTIEIRIGSSEITENPDKFIKYMNFISGALNYALDDDFLETENGIKLYVHDNGKWKIMKDDKLVASSALVSKNYLKAVGGRSDSLVTLPRRTGSEEGRIWAKVEKLLRNRPQALKKLQKSFDKWLKTNDSGKEIMRSGHLKQYVDKFLKDGNITALEYLITTKMIDQKTVINLLKGSL